MSATGSAAARRRRLTGGILAAGLLASLVLFAAASRGNGDEGYGPNDSKQYLRQMEVYGGTANVLATDIREWFGSLWHGRRLAATVAVITLVSASAVWFLSDPGPAPLPGGPDPVSGRGGSGPDPAS